jgi:hypothetical protein
VLIACDDGPYIPVEPGDNTWAQPLRLAYAGHALRLQGGQAQVVLVLPGAGQTSRQSAYSMLTRCQEQVHVFVDRDSQCTGPYADADPLIALARRWTRDARKIAASAQLEAQAIEPYEAPPGEQFVPAAQRHQRGAVVHRGWDSDASMTELLWPWCTGGERGGAGMRTAAAHHLDDVHRYASLADELEVQFPAPEQREQPAMEDDLGWELDL